MARAVRPGQSTIPVLKPKLPTLTQLAPYIRLIDECRCYSNVGPLCNRFTAELARHLSCPAEALVMAASATAGITAALLALGLSRNSLCLMPSWTFAATPHAALAAGLTPYFLDVERQSWALDPVSTARSITALARPVGAVIVVSPFGCPLDIGGWERFQAETAIPVIVDAAAGFDTVRHSQLISIVSLHATKIFGAGEGGFAVCPTAEFRDRMAAASNFGFAGARSAQMHAVNSKMSEYHAAVALANLENWPEVRFRHVQITAWYKDALRSVPDVALQPGYGDGWACGTTNIVVETDFAENLARYLWAEGIETRLWWGAGCHVQPAFQLCERGALPTTEFLGARVLGLPHYVDMQEEQVRLVVSALAKGLRSLASRKRRSA